MAPGGPPECAIDACAIPQRDDLSRGHHRHRLHAAAGAGHAVLHNPAGAKRARVYAQSCQSCHGIGLADGPFGPALKGPEFRQNWFGRSPDALFTATKSTMPPTAPRSLRDDQYAELVALMLAENGVQPSDAPLPADIDQLRTMFLPWMAPVPGAEIRGGLKLPDPPARPDPLAALTPVTDAMLARPAPGEWLTWRRTWDSQGFSPLDQITRANAGNLRVKWIWSLPPGPNEGTPLFHDGVLFVHGYSRSACRRSTRVRRSAVAVRAAPRAAPSVKRTMALYDDRSTSPPPTPRRRVVDEERPAGLGSRDRPEQERDRLRRSRLVRWSRKAR
jgi:hypothetical protein